ncbi:DUF3471 domain-containing protein [candidate division KSB1 bacterium]|nr:serine hydrolase [candidate division KSB1 bacterium]RQW06272.1 MAG: DUF3471 domain-containing protein [candidate division KSB1 bacterium]
MKAVCRLHFVLLFFVVVLSFMAPANPAANLLTEDEFISNWSITEPITAAAATDQESQQKAFSTEALDLQTLTASATTGELVLNEKSYAWNEIQAATGIVDLVKEFGALEYCYVYAIAHLTSATERNTLFGLGSDDGVKVWLNGELIHENFIGRPVNPDDDLLGVQLQAGENILILKIHNLQRDWGFCLRPLSQNKTSDALARAVNEGNVDDVELLLSYGADPNGMIGPDLTPLHIATIKGRQQIADLLQQSGADPQIPMPEKTKIIEFLFERAIKDNYPGASVLIAQDGRILYENGYGLANIEQAIPIEPRTTFRIGSVTKQFTAAAILKLQEEGKLSVQDKLSTFIPDFPRGDEVRLFHLLTHTSGITTYTDTHDFLDKVTDDITTDQLIEEIKSLGYTFSPGEAWSYCNSGYFLLGYIVEKVSGLTFDAYLMQTFFQPLDMQQTGVYRKGLNLPHEAIGYSFENDSVALALDWNMDFAGGAGNLYSNVEDLYKWNEAVFGGTVLKPASLSAAFAPVVLNNGEQAQAMGGGYGYGWSITNLRGLQCISHGGGLHGFNTALMRLPEKNMTVVVLCNCAPNIPNLNPGQISRDIAEIYHYESMTRQEERRISTTVDTSLYDDYVGKYDYGQAILTVRRSGDRLFAQLTGQAEYEIFPSAPDKFFWKIVDAQIEFVRDENGHIIHGLHTQNGATIKVARIEESQEVAVPVEILQTYVGDYELAPNFILSITLEGEQLYSQATGQSKVEIYAKSETEFFLKVVVASITFVKDANGLVTGLVLDQGSVHIEAPKIK